MRTKMQKRNTKLIAFHVPNELYDELIKAADRHGFPAVSAYCRAVAEQSIGRSDSEIAMTRIGEMRAKVQANLLRTLSSHFASLTAEEMLADE